METPSLPTLLVLYTVTPASKPELIEELNMELKVASHAVLVSTFLFQQNYERLDRKTFQYLPVLIYPQLQPTLVKLTLGYIEADLGVNIFKSDTNGFWLKLNVNFTKLDSEVKRLRFGYRLGNLCRIY